MAVAIVFETHSLTTDNEAGLATGWLDGRLSVRGRVLAAELGRRRCNDGIRAVFSSDLGRAVETVALAFDGSGIPVHLDARLRECDYGAWNGMPVSRLERERAQRISRPFPDGESYLQVVDRVAEFLEELARDWDRARVLVVGHSATRWALDHLLAGAAPDGLVAARSPGRKAGRMPCLRVGSAPVRRHPRAGRRRRRGSRGRQRSRPAPKPMWQDPRSRPRDEGWRDGRAGVGLGRGGDRRAGGGGAGGLAAARAPLRPRRRGSASPPRRSGRSGTLCANQAAGGT